ncbi:hypothetical protein AF71_00062760, partial [Rhizobium sp. 57MFTsu3.2]|nr:hypothetical protein [Rhizobium sp. 57MFTsu3.2]
DQLWRRGFLIRHCECRQVERRIWTNGQETGLGKPVLPDGTSSARERVGPDLRTPIWARDVLRSQREAGHTSAPDQCSRLSEDFACIRGSVHTRPANAFSLFISSAITRSTTSGSHCSLTRNWRIPPSHARMSARRFWSSSTPFSVRPFVPYSQEEQCRASHLTPEEGHTVLQ